MLLDLIASELGVSLLSVVLGIGVGLMTNNDSVASWIGSVLITCVVVLISITAWSHAPWAALLYVFALGLSSLLGMVQRYADSPLLVGESYWRKVALTLVHPRAIRRAAAIERSESNA